ncbi:MAG: methyl-accepting chemotaxis protein [Burkholderiaceae bacterium]
MATSLQSNGFSLRRFHIGTRLILGFGSILAIVVAMVVLNSVLNEQNKKKLIVELEAAEKKSVLATAMKSAILQGGLAMINIGIQSEVDAMQKEEQKAKDQRAKYLESRDKLAALGLTDTENQIVGKIAQVDTQIESALKEALGQALAFNAEGSTKVIATRINPLNQQAISEINKLVELQQAASHEVLVRSVAEDTRLKLLLFISSACAFVVASLFAWTITRSIISPLRDAVSIAKTVANGELSMEVKLEGNDEISELMIALKDMDDSLSKIVGKVRSATYSIAEASSGMASVNADLSARTQSQVASLEQTAHSMETLTQTEGKNADSARNANQLVLQASGLAEKGGSVVEQVVATMGSIEESSRKIVDIISVIDGIAFQTNILALNAAVEAARAGEQGRGFAVVAAEVRSLSQRSASAAHEIKALIGDSVQKVDQGSKLVHQAGKAMDEIVTAVKRVESIVGEISVASQEQKTGIEAVNATIAKMDEMTHQNAELVQQAASAASSMQHQAKDLEKTVEIFKIDGQNHNTHSMPAKLGRSAVPLLR